MMIALMHLVHCAKSTVLIWLKWRLPILVQCMVWFIQWMLFVNYGLQLKNHLLHGKLVKRPNASNVARLQVNPFVRHVPSSNGWPRFNLNQIVNQF